MTDNREIWEIEYCLLLKFAASYLREYNATGTQAGLLSTGYGKGDLKRWAQDHITELLEKCEELCAGRDLSTAARNAVRDSAAKLDRAGLFGNVQSAGILRIEA